MIPSQNKNTHGGKILTESATHIEKCITWLACTWLEKYTMSAAINNVTCFNCILGRKEKEINF
jgi:hypothetical protein